MSTLELSKCLFLLFSSRSGNLEQVELDSLGQRAALTNDDFVTDVNYEIVEKKHKYLDT
jgi:hypothetical protein